MNLTTLVPDDQAAWKAARTPTDDDRELRLNTFLAEGKWMTIVDYKA